MVDAPDADELMRAIATCAMATLDEGFAYRKGFASRGDAIRMFEAVANPVNILRIFDRYEDLKAGTR